MPSGTELLPAPRASLQRYSFQSARFFKRGFEGWRPSDQALHEARAFLLEIGAGDSSDFLLGEKLPGVRRQLLRWASDVPLNIRWYEDRLWNNFILTYFGAIAVGVVGVALGILTACADKLPTLGTTATAGLVSSVALMLLQLLSTLTDRRAQVTLFWKSSADLQERLYSFEDRWRGRPLVQQFSGEGPRVSAEFLVDLGEEIAKARAIEREERTAFFASMISPRDLLSIVTQGIGAIRTSRDSAVAARKEEERLVQVKADQVASERHIVQKADANYRAKVDALQRLPSDTTPVERAKLALEAESARLDLEEARARLRALLPGALD